MLKDLSASSTTRTHTVFAVVHTNTLGWTSFPVVAELADATPHPPQLIPSVAVVFTGSTVVIPVGGTGEVTMQGCRKYWTSSHWEENIMVTKQRSN